MKKILLLFLILLAIAAGGYFLLKIQTPSSGPSGKLSEDSVNPKELTPVSGPSRSTAQNQSDPAQPAKPRVEIPRESLTDWSAVEKKYSDRLVPSFGENGRLLSIRGEALMEQRGKTSFDPANEALVKARAREVIGDLASLMGVDARNFTDIQFRTGEISAQAFFKQTVDGLPVLPGGTATIVFGPSGEILEMSSDALSSVRIENTTAIPVEQAKASLGDPTAEGGRMVVWTDPSGSGKKAYDFVSRGYQVVIDAQTGATLFKRDRRHF